MVADADSNSLFQSTSSKVRRRNIVKLFIPNLAPIVSIHFL
ncbi:hypothetical protein LEP1GSC170_6036 [Leptospira interrogans serovar Bataviae str. HAI135]|nr:hypothetical protein LEP1GSC170_6036 [Leptospira interrogans serovar Bataviae str. HAI135]